MSRDAKKQYLLAIRARYRQAGKKKKGRILDEFCAVCGYERKYAIRLLNRHRKSPRKKPGPPRKYGPEVVEIVKEIWFATDQLCSKRLVAALPLWLPHYRDKQGALSEEVRQKILEISPATVDRLLRPVRAKLQPKGLSGTRPGTLLRTQIPIRTSNWDITQPGFLEADSVAHCGNSLAGNFVWSLTFTDICTGWTENRAIWNKGAEGVIAQVKSVESSLVFPILGFDCDNGAEFLNHHLFRYFTDRKPSVAFTRSRPYHRNDNAHVEQKQWTHVRQLLGYDRFDNPALVDRINDLYCLEWSQFQNFFRPSAKLQRKERLNSKYTRYYDTPTTPYQRLLQSPYLSDDAKQQLTSTFRSLNPFLLKKNIDRKLKRVFNLLP